MVAKRLHRVEVAGKLGLAQCGVDFPMANVMQQNDRTFTATFGTRDQVMQALFHIGRDGSQA